jgi:prophage tail gpP-like protein
LAELVLRAGGLNVEGWTSIQVTRSIEQIADTFALAISTSEVGEADLDEDTVCEILIDGEVVISGYIDDVDGSDDSESTTLAVTGRSRAGDLVDCSAVHAAWRDTSGLQIAADLCEPFGIKVLSEGVDLPKERYFKPAEGETVFDVLYRLGRMHGARVVSRPDGSIVFTRTGLLRYPDVVIARGVNIKAAHVRKSGAERYSRYIFKAQAAADDDEYGEAVAAQSYELVDDGVGRFRPLVVQVDGQRNSKGQFVKGQPSPLELAALWERATRAGRSLQLEYDVADPLDMSGSWAHKYGLWEPNTIVAVDDDVWGVHGEFLVTEVTLARDNSGTRAQVSLTYPEAYDVKYPPRKKKPKGVSW